MCYYFHTTLEFPQRRNKFCDDLEEPLLSLIRNLRNIGVGLQTYAYICVGLQEAQISQCSASYEAQCTSPLNSTPLQTPQNILRSYPGQQNFQRIFLLRSRWFAAPMWWNRKMAHHWSCYFFTPILKDTMKIHPQPQIILVVVFSWSGTAPVARKNSTLQWLRKMCEKLHSWESMFWNDASHILAIHEF
jgi:hypothetical protein